MVTYGDVISLNKKEALELASKESKKRLGMTISEFRKRQQAGKLPRSTAVRDIEMILKFAE
ncbi:MAG: hypothetical protein NTZ04_01070 [Chloroflexi bacterium]|nr:hypothetical protein [Chloroflexota bacterium]